LLAPIVVRELFNFKRFQNTAGITLFPVIVENDLMGVVLRGVYSISGRHINAVVKAPSPISLIGPRSFRWRPNFGGNNAPGSVRPDLHTSSAPGRLLSGVYVVP
jgi:hypothetical protein